MSSLNLKLGKTCHGWKRKTICWHTDARNQQHGHCCGSALLSLDGMVTYVMYSTGCISRMPGWTVMLSNFSGFVHRNLWDVRPQWSGSPVCCPTGKLDPLVTHSVNNWQTVSSVVYQWQWIIKSSPRSSATQVYWTDFLRPLTWAKSKAPASPSDWITSERTWLSWKQKVTAEYALKKC